MFDVEDAVDDGIDLDQLLFAVESAMTALNHIKTPAAKYLMGSLESISDDIETYI